MHDEWSEQRQRLIDSVNTTEVTLTVPAELHDHVREWAERHHVTLQDAFLAVIMNGLAYLEGKATLERLERADVPQAVLDELQKTLRQFMDASSAYASMRFKAYRLSQDNQALEMRESGLRAENAFLRRRLEIFREEEARLRQSLAVVERELAALKAAVPSPDPQVEPDRHGPAPAGRLRRFLNGLRHGAS